MACRVAMYGEPTDLPMAAFAQGLKTLGVSFQWRSISHWTGDHDIEDYDVIVLHGIRGDKHRAAFSAYTRVGATIIVIDLGYMKRAHRLNRQGFWYIGTGGLAQFPSITRPHDRFEALGIELQDYNYDNCEYGLILGQVPGDQGHGGQVNFELVNAYHALAKDLRDLGLIPIFRPHPYAEHVTPQNIALAPDLPLEKLAQRVRVNVSMSSNAGLDCLILGTPSVALMPCHWSELSAPWPTAHLSSLTCPDAEIRKDHLAKLAYSQWLLEEMELGQPQKQLAQDGLVVF